MSDFEEKDFLDDEEFEEFETFVEVDENGVETSYVILEAQEKDGVTYLLVMEEEFLDDEDNEEVECRILKSIGEDGDEIIYDFIYEDDDEFEMAYKLFEKSNDDFDIEL